MMINNRLTKQTLWFWILFDSNNLLIFRHKHDALGTNVPWDTGGYAENPYVTLWCQFPGKWVSDDDLQERPFWVAWVYLCVASDVLLFLFVI